MIQDDLIIENSEGLLCHKCQLTLRAEKIHIRYLFSTFPTRLLRCPKCGLTYLPEEHALGKAREVEMSLEEK